MNTDGYSRFFPDDSIPLHHKKIVKPQKKVEIVFVDTDTDTDSDTDSDKSPREIVFEPSSKEESKEDFSDPDPIFGLRILKPFVLYPHQIEAIHWMKNIENSPVKRLNMRGGILAEAPGLGKCLSPDTLVLLYNSDVKKAKDVKVGDVLLGDDNNPRKVISISTGRDEMYKINQSKGESYVVNKEHILSLKYSKHKVYNWSESGYFKLTWIEKKNYTVHTKNFNTMSEDKCIDNTLSKEKVFERMIEFRNTIQDDDIIDIEVHKYLCLDETLKRDLKGFKTPFDGWKETELDINPWMLGYLLGKGKTSGPYSSKIYKNIPKEYITNSRNIRLQLLSGFIDYDGYINDGYCEIFLKSSKCVNDIIYICRSLGFYVEENIFKKEGDSTFYHRIVFRGDGIEEIQSVFHKNVNKNGGNSLSDSLKASLTSDIDVGHIGEGEYIGFVIDGNRRFLLGDFTVTHNTCITACLCMTESQNPKEYLNKSYPKDISSMIDRYVVSHNYPNLVVCSKTVAYSWKKEIAKFFGKSCPFFYMHRSALGKKFDLLSYDSIKDYKIIITTYETVMGIANKNKLTEKQFSIDNFNRRSGIKPSKRPSHDDCIKTKGGMLLFKVPWNRIIADESHRIANPTSSTFYSMMALWGDKKWNLSGTPLRNYSSDLYSQFRFNGYDKIIIAKQFNYDEYQRGKMNEFTLYKTYDAAGIVLPPITRKKIEISLEGREKEIYDYYHDSMKKVYNGFLVGSYGFSNVLTLFLRLRQLCVAPYTILSESSRNYKGNDDEEYTLSQKILDGMTGGLSTWVKDKNGSSGIESSKMKALISTLKSFNKGEKTLVFTSFKKVIDIAALAMDEKMPHSKYLILDGDVTGNERDETINKFKDNDYNYSVLFISYKVGSEGLTLVEASNVIHMENWWTPVVQEQAERRVWRIGQKKPVKVFNITIIGSIEERIDVICADKTKMIDDFKSSKGKGSVPALDASTIGRLIR